MKRNTRWDKYLLMTWRKLWIIVIVAFFSIVLHNLIYALLRSRFAEGWDEPFFFIIAVILVPLYFIISIIYTVIKMIKTKKYPQPIFYIKLLISIIIGFVLAWILVLVDFLNMAGIWPFGIILSVFAFAIVSLIESMKGGKK